MNVGLETNEPLLSIIITSYNAARIKDIFELLDSVSNQTYANIETVYIAESSLDLYEKIKAYVKEKAFANMILVFNKEKLGLSGARNLGIKKACGDILAFVDDDVLLFPEWATNLVKTYRNHSVIGVAGPALPLWEDVSMDWLPKELYWIVSCTDWCKWNKITEVRNVWGHNMSFSREAFERCGLLLQTTGFALSSGSMGPIGEDLAFSMVVRMKTGKSIVYNPYVKVWHRVYKTRLSWKSIVKRAYWVGHSRFVLRRSYNRKCGNKDLLSIENRLLNQMLTNLFPEILKNVFRNPVTAWRKFSITLVVLFLVMAGYLNIKIMRF